MSIIGVDCAILGVEEMDDAKRFCRDIGLTEAESGSAGGTYLTQDGTGLLLRRAADPGLPGAVGPRVNARETVWGVAAAADIETIAAELAKDRQIQRGADGALRTTDDGGFPIAFRVTVRHAYPAVPARANAPGLPPQRPRNARIDFAAPVRPRSIGHIVFYVDDLAVSTAFYTERLGFRITDSYRGRSVFLRAPGSHDHHNLFLIERAQAPGLHHVEFHVTDFNEVMTGGKRLTERGWKTVYGPGRHVLGSNYYWYFHTPCGGAMELAADIDWVDDDWVAGEWDYTPDMVSAWQTTLVPGH